MEGRRKLGGVEMKGVSHGQVWQSPKPNSLCAWGEKGKSETMTSKLMSITFTFPGET